MSVTSPPASAPAVMNDDNDDYDFMISVKSERAKQKFLHYLSRFFSRLNHLKWILVRRMLH